VGEAWSEIGSYYCWGLSSALHNIRCWGRGVYPDDYRG